MNYFSFAEKNDRGGAVFHDYLYRNDIFDKSGAPVQVSHEWYFTECLEYAVDEDKSLADKFAMFVLQLHPGFRYWDADKNDWSHTVESEIWLTKKHFEERANGLKDERRESIQAMKFGDIATDFMIRFCGKSLIKAQGQPIIQTAQSNCHKRFEELLSEGYSLQRRAKVRWISRSAILEKIGIPPELTEDHDVLETLGIEPAKKGVFEKLPVLPTQDTGYPIDEVIENYKTGEYVRVS